PGGGGGDRHTMLVSPVSQPDMSAYPEAVRQAVFEQAGVPPDHPVHAILDRVLRTRHEVAALSGHASYGELTCKTQQLAFRSPADIVDMLEDTVGALDN